MNTIDAGRARLVRSGAVHVFAGLKPFGGDSVGGVVCDLLSFDRLLEFEFEKDSVSLDFVFESPFEPKAVMNDKTVNHARDAHDQRTVTGRGKKRAKAHEIVDYCLRRIFDLPRERTMLRTVVGQPLDRPPV